MTLSLWILCSWATHSTQLKIYPSIIKRLLICNCRLWKGTQKVMCRSAIYCCQTKHHYWKLVQAAQREVSKALWYALIYGFEYTKSVWQSSSTVATQATNTNHTLLRNLLHHSLYAVEIPQRSQTRRCEQTKGLMTSTEWKRFWSIIRNSTYKALHVYYFFILPLFKPWT